MGLPNGVHHLAICTKDIKSQIEFYTRVVGMDLPALCLDARRGLDFSRLRAHRQQLDCLRAGGRRSENKFLKGHRSVSRPWNSLNTDARSAGVQPARTFPTNIHERPL